MSARYCITDVGLMTLSSAILARLLRRTLKYQRNGEKDELSSKGRLNALQSHGINTLISQQAINEKQLSGWLSGPQVG
jgi:hypothetical protein